MLRSALSWARLSFMLPILARESLRAASSICSLFSSRESSALLLSTWQEHDRYTRAMQNMKTQNIKCAKARGAQVVFKLPEPALQRVGLALPPAAASQPPPAGESPLLQTTLHAERRPDSHSDPTAFVCIKKQYAYGAITSVLKATNEIVRLIRLIVMCRGVMVGTKSYCWAYTYTETLWHTDFLLLHSIFPVFHVDFPFTGVLKSGKDSQQDFA